MDDSIQLASLKCKKEKFLAHEVLTWKLKIRINWIDHGDANTNNFHFATSARKNANYIWALKNEEGDMVNDVSQLKALGERFFSTLLKDDGSSSISDQLKVIKMYPSFLSNEEADSFFSKVTLAKVESTLKGFKKRKSSGPDGWPVESFLRFFKLVGVDLLMAME